MRRSRGPALFPGPHPSLSLGAPFWPSGLTIRRSRPPTAAAELRALVPSPALCRPLFIPGFCLSQRFLLWGLGRSPGFACWLGVSFKPFGPLALASQAPAAIILAALRRFRGSVLFHGPRPSSSQGAPFWPSGLTVRRSRPPTAAAELRALSTCFHLPPPASTGREPQFPTRLARLRHHSALSNTPAPKTSSNSPPPCYAPCA